MIYVNDRRLGLTHSLLLRRLGHGGEAAGSRREFQRLTVASQRALIAFLENLVLFKLEEDEVVVPPPATTQLAPRFRRR